MALTLDCDSGKCDSLVTTRREGLSEHRFGGLFLCSIAPFQLVVRLLLRFLERSVDLG
jgi:hypothetical protein